MMDTGQHDKQHDKRQAKPTDQPPGEACDYIATERNRFFRARLAP